MHAVRNIRRVSCIARVGSNRYASSKAEEQPQKCVMSQCLQVRKEKKGSKKSFGLKRVLEEVMKSDEKMLRTTSNVAIVVMLIVVTGRTFVSPPAPLQMLVSQKHMCPTLPASSMHTWSTINRFIFKLVVHVLQMYFFKAVKNSF